MKLYFLGLLLLSVAAQAQPNKLFAELYQPASPVVQQMARVIYYRLPGNMPDKPGAHVYVDGEYHATLLPGGFTAFCLAPGAHSINANFRDGTHYPGKSYQRYGTKLKAGATYFLRVNESSRAPQPMKRADAQHELQTLKRQIHMLNRASSVIPCVFDSESEQIEQRYVIDRDVLFSPDSSELTVMGRIAVAELAVMLRHDLTRINQVEIVVRSQATPFYGLALQQANNLRQQLIRDAVPGDRIKLIADAEPANAQRVQQINVYAK